MSPTGPGFDRLRTRTPPRPLGVVGAPRPTTGQAARVLFSEPPPPPPRRARGLVLRCGTCGARSPLRMGEALRAGLPSVHLPLLALAGARHTSWMRCPACERRTWVCLAPARWPGAAPQAR